jgi:hypothetical protein
MAFTYLSQIRQILSKTGDYRSLLTFEYCFIAVRFDSHELPAGFRFQYSLQTARREQPVRLVVYLQ